MLKKLLLFTIILPLISFGQNYKFNLLTKYDNIYPKGKMESIHYSNKEDDSYFFKISKIGSDYLGYLVDYKKNDIHIFKAIEYVGPNNEIAYSYKYKLTYKLIHKKKKKIKGLTYFLESIEGNYLIYNLELNYKKENVKIQVKVLPYYNNMFRLFRMSCLHTNELNEELFADIKGLVVEATIKHKKNISTHKLVAIENVDLSLKVD